MFTCDYGQLGVGISIHHYVVNNIGVYGYTTSRAFEVYTYGCYGTNLYIPHILRMYFMFIFSSNSVASYNYA